MWLCMYGIPVVQYGGDTKNPENNLLFFTPRVNLVDLLIEDKVLADNVHLPYNESTDLSIRSRQRRECKADCINLRLFLLVSAVTNA